MFKKSLAILIGMFFLLMFLPPTSLALTGGPDAGGYEYYDSNEGGVAPFSWESIEDSEKSVEIPDFKTEGSVLVGPVPMGFTFTFYGVNYTKIYISKYGYLTFNDGPEKSYFNLEPIPTRGGHADNYIAGMRAYLHPGI